MNYTKYLYLLKANHKFLNQESALLRDTLDKYIRSHINTYGVVVKKLSNGELDADLKPTNKVSAIDLSEGYIICDDGGELRVIKVPAQTVGFNALSNGITYKLYIVPKSSSYEPGTIALVNGSDMVTLSGGDFQEKVYICTFYD
jgi:hypothetical protein